MPTDNGVPDSISIAQSQIRYWSGLDSSPSAVKVFKVNVVVRDRRIVRDPG
jgi:hypothetical protein